MKTVTKSFVVIGILVILTVVLLFVFSTESARRRVIVRHNDDHVSITNQNRYQVEVVVKRKISYKGGDSSEITTHTFSAGKTVRLETATDLPDVKIEYKIIGVKNAGRGSPNSKLPLKRKLFKGLEQIKTIFTVGLDTIVSIKSSFIGDPQFWGPILFLVGAGIVSAFINSLSTSSKMGNLKAQTANHSCWFCGSIVSRNETNSAKIYSHSKAKKSTFTKTVTTSAIAIPRCKKCRIAHIIGMWLSCVVALVILVFFVGVYVEYSFSLYAQTFKESLGTAFFVILSGIFWILCTLFLYKEIFGLFFNLFFPKRKLPSYGHKHPAVQKL